VIGLCLAVPGSAAKQHLPVPLQQRHIGMKIRDLRRGRVTVRLQRHTDVKDFAVGWRHDFQREALAERGNLPRLLRSDVRQNLQLQILTTGHDSGGHSRLQPLLSAGAGNHHALHIFNNVAADLQPAPIGQCAQCHAGFGGSQSDGNRLCAAHGGDQFLPQDLKVLFVMRCLFHLCSLPWCQSDKILVAPGHMQNSGFTWLYHQLQQKKTPVQQLPSLCKSNPSNVFPTFPGVGQTSAAGGVHIPVFSIPSRGNRSAWE